MLKRNWALIAFVYLAFAEVLSWAPVPDLSLCLIQPEDDEQSSGHDEEKYCPAFHIGAALVFEKANAFLEAHDKSVVGGFTIVLAISTIGLWLATNKLWDAGERQLQLLTESSAEQAESTRASLAIAAASAKAAQRSGEHFAVAERAWIFIHTGGSEEASGTRENPFEGRRFYLTVVNSGKTPAVRANVYTDHAIVEADDPIPHFTPKPDKEVWEVSFPPGTSGRTKSRYVTRQDIEAINRQEKKMLLYARITYRTMFIPEALQFTEVCFQAHFEGEMVDRNTGQRNPFYLFTAIGPQNEFT